MFEKGSFTLASRAINLAYKVSFSFATHPAASLP